MEKRIELGLRANSSLGIHHDAHIHPAYDGLAECANDGIACAVAGEDVVHHVYRVPGMRDQPQLDCQGALGIFQGRAEGPGISVIDRDIRFFAITDGIDRQG